MWIECGEFVRVNGWTDGWMDGCAQCAVYKKKESKINNKV